MLFDLDETLLDRTGSLRIFLADQYRRFRRDLGDPPFTPWLERFLILDARGSVHKQLVYPVILSEFDGNTAFKGQLESLAIVAAARDNLKAQAEELAIERERGAFFGLRRSAAG